MKLERHHIDPTLKDRDPERYKKFLPEDIIWVTRSEHKKIHMAIDKANGVSGKYGHKYTDEERKHLSDIRKGVPKTDDWKQKISKGNKGKHEHHGENNPMYGKHQSDEQKEKARETKRKNGTLGIKTRGSSGMHWYNNGTESVLAEECPEGYVKGRLITPR